MDTTATISRDAGEDFSPVVLAASPGEPAYSTNLPSPAVVRPFGLSQVTAVTTTSSDEIDSLRYDPQCQVSLTADNQVAAKTDLINRAGTQTTTNNDKQWFIDRD